eukprot:CAMPEP_0197030760 /NCGR_PEP_ID=MMETSP1384-20130603/9920_1 /TAXON_ID=29189 /ORGANISM="Ammonia sp." /LENGTH=402 /DNA_ID=CAMNT_0042460167 /DNA_START=105 /DNA_END=1313 /DNA_ORIENTATION=+
MADDKSTPENWKEQIEAIISTEGTNNTQCADCNTAETEWSVWNHGVFVCIKCAGIHRQIGVHISKVKGTVLDTWKNNELFFVKSIGGNVNANKKLENRKPKYFINPSECPSVDVVRKYFIRQKYENKLFQAEMKEDAGTFDMPQPLKLGTFLQEDNKKKAYLQLLSRTLYHFKNNHDSYDTQHHDVTQINAKISDSDSNYTDFVLNVYSNDENNSLYRYRSADANDIDFLIDWLHWIRRAKQYYTYLDSHPNHTHDDEHKQQDNAAPAKPADALTEIKLKDLENATVLGIASKKGGGARSWRKRWWILLDGYLYYFKDDFRTNKKANGIGVPQGNVPLHQADIAWDSDRSRTGKQHALIIATPNRTYYVQPQQQSKEKFFSTVESCCAQMWNRQPFDFAQMG